MRDIVFVEDIDSQVLDVAPMTSMEAHLRIQEAERGIANGEVVPHANVIRHSYELLEKYGG